MGLQELSRVLDTTRESSLIRPLAVWCRAPKLGINGPLQSRTLGDEAGEDFPGGAVRHGASTEDRKNSGYTKTGKGTQKPTVKGDDNRGARSSGYQLSEGENQLTLTVQTMKETSDYQTSSDLVTSRDSGYRY